jgi:hypothetical protein
MTGVKLVAVLPAAAFALLTLVLVCIGALPGNEAAWAATSIALAFVPSGLCVPCGWRRRAAEAMLLPVAWALAMIGDATLRSMALPPLLLLAAFTAAAAARGTSTVVTICIALAVRAAAGLGLVGFPFWRVAIVVLAVAALAAAGARVLGGRAGHLLALLAGAAPLERGPLVALLALLVLGVVLARWGRTLALGVRVARGWYAGALAVALILVALAPWGGILPVRAFPAAGWASAALLLVVALATPLLPAAVAGAAWLGLAFALGPVQPPPPDRPGLDLTAAAPRTLLPASEGGRYRAEIALANAAALPQGTLVATIRNVGRELPIRAGIETAEWAHERPDVRGRGPHALPASPVWRPVGCGRTATWGVAGVVSGELPAGVRPQIERAAALPPAVVVSVAAAGSVRPTPPRDWPLPAWLLAATVAVAVLQLAGGLWRAPSAALPWALLTAGALAARIPVEPLRLLVERHSVDLAAAAVLSAWLPAAWRWLRQRHVFLAAAALLVPLALATPHLTPPLYGDEPFHLIVLDSLARDHDLDLANNYDLEHHPYNRIYVTGTIFLHSPVLAFLLLPGYLVGGRAGALVLLALAGAALVALVTRRLEQLGAQQRSTVPVAMTLLLSYPLATFATQIWVEVVAAAFVAACLVLLARPGPSARLRVAALAALATAAKIRLALLFVPLALAAWRPRRLRPRELGTAAFALSAVVAIGLAVSWLFLGHPLGPRRLPDLVPHDLVQPITVLGGLIFDPAGGLAFAAPLALLSLAGLTRLWRRGGDGERALVIGAGLTVLALLHSREWYGGGAPPARYLVPALPLFALAGALALTAPARGRRLACLLLPPSVLVWWVFVTRPHFTVNPGDGGYWLADAAARRFAADARHLVPSFLRFNTATIVMPILLCLGALLLFACAHRWPALGRGLVRAATPLWLVLACVALVVLRLRLDRIVEIEDPQVVHIGGALEPPPGTFARYSLPNGWRIADEEGVEVPLNLAAGDKLRLEGWLEGAARSGATIAAQWDGGAPRAIFVAASGRGDVALPDAPGSGRHRLLLLLHAPQGGEAVLDRLVVQR